MLKSTLSQIKNVRPLFWANPGWKPAAECLGDLPLAYADIAEAEKRLARFAPLLEECFPELRPAGGLIESDLIPCPRLTSWLEENDGLAGLAQVYIKADHALPVAGSIKARGGIHAVLHHAEKLALDAGVVDEKSDYRLLLEPEFRALTGKHEISVGSTGNLGLSIGIIGSALGFRVNVHMSHEAREWKKKRLRTLGVNVIEHACDYTRACVEARRIAAEDPRIHFIDDENAVELFLGYAVAITRLKQQFDAAGIQVDAGHPVFLYLPCGVGGAPGGITFAARHVFGDHVHCFFVEPVQAPCMTIGLVTGCHSETSIYDFGLTLQTDADGLAVSRPSGFVGKLMDPLLDACITLTDRDMYRYLLALYECENIEVEPSSSLACGCLKMLYRTEDGISFLKNRNLPIHPGAVTHVVWTTGGHFVPAGEHQVYRKMAGMRAGGRNSHTFS